MLDETIKNRLGLLRKKLPIDQYQLEQECKEQPALYEEIGSLVSEARAEAKRKSTHVDFVKADLSIKIRKNPSAYGLDKVTESAVDATINIQKEYRDAVQESIDADEYANALSVLQTSAEQRKSMLKDLVSLFIHEYYASKTTPNVDKAQLADIEAGIMTSRAKRAAEKEGE